MFEEAHILNPKIQTALVIDDDSDVQSFVEIALADGGVCAESMTTFNSDDLCASKADLFIVDMFLNQSDGVEVLEVLGSTRSTTPILLISALPSEVLKAAVEYGQMQGLHIIGALNKPFSASQLINIIDSSTALPPRRLSPDEVMDAANEGRLELRYQPKINLFSGDVAGVEVLSRIRTRNDLAVPPAAFLHAIENRAISTQFALEVVKIALSELGALAAFQGSGWVAINIDVGVLEDVGFPAKAMHLCTALGYKPEQLLFEITERQMAESSRNALRGALRLTIQGFGLSLDDYGVGLSDHHRLEQLPVGEVKLDKSLLDKAAISHDVPELKALLGYAKERSLRVVCEGKLLSAARRLRIPYAQGYLLARPMAAGSLSSWLTSRALNAAPAHIFETTTVKQQLGSAS